MNVQFWLEMVGYFGSVVVAISLMMRSSVGLRVINSIGCLVFVIYGILIHAYPVAILNGFSFCINAFHLIQMFRDKDYLQLFEISPYSIYLNNLLDFYKDDIEKIFPDYTHDTQLAHSACLVLRNMIPVSVIIQQRCGSQSKILLDYTIPTYRDFRVAHFFYHEKADYFNSLGIESFVAEPGKTHHAKYLERVGFRLKDGKYILELGRAIIKDSQI